MTRQLGRLEKVGKEALVKPSSLEGLRSWGGFGPSRTRTVKRQFETQERFMGRLEKVEQGGPSGT
jgi:hypothetical protein